MSVDEVWLTLDSALQQLYWVSSLYLSSSIPHPISREHIMLARACSTERMEDRPRRLHICSSLQDVAALEQANPQARIHRPPSSTKAMCASVATSRGIAAQVSLCHRHERMRV